MSKRTRTLSEANYAQTGGGAALSNKGFKTGISNFALLSRSEKNWVTTRLIEELSLHERSALDDFIASMSSAQDAIRGQVSVFLSHSSRDKRFVRSLSTYLEKCGIRTWLDEADLIAGQSLANRLCESVSKTNLLIVVLSKHSAASPWVTKELAIASRREIDGRSIRIVPILKESCEIPPIVADKLYLDFRTTRSRRKNAPVLVDTLMKLGSEIEGFTDRRVLSRLQPGNKQKQPRIKG
jgi:hypothetical protein